MTTDFKNPPRIRDKAVYREFHAAGHRCLVCGCSGPNAAHLLGGADREDVLDGLVPLCGSGAHGCHGAWHGHAYTRPSGAWVTPADVKSAVARYLRSDEGEKARTYLVERLGGWAAEHYVQKLEGRA